MTSGYKCAKISISLSISRSKFPQCHECAFLKQTNIMFDCFRLEAVCNLRDIFPCLLDISLFESLTQKVFNHFQTRYHKVSYISAQKHTQSYHFIIGFLILLNRINSLQKKQLYGNIEQNFHFLQFDKRQFSEHNVI